MITAILEINNLSLQYLSRAGVVTALDSVTLDVGENEFLAVVGESGCGKSSLGLSVIGLLPQRTARVMRGSIMYKGKDLVKMNQDQLRSYRGTEIAMIFQEPLTSLIPVYRVGDQIAEAIVLRKIRESGESVSGEVMQKAFNSKKAYVPPHMPRLKRGLPQELRKEIIAWLNLVRIADPEQVFGRYPFELSGGMRQRVMIAMALSQEPALLIADEPTTALDVTTQAQVLKLMHELMEKVKTSIILVTHDLAVASQVADRVVVMYAGRVAETAEVRELFSNPMHPYSKGLLNCIPSGTKDNSQLEPIPGSIPDLMRVPEGCSFSPRCPYSFDKCRSNRPLMISVGQSHEVACFLHDKR